MNIIKQIKTGHIFRNYTLATFLWFGLSLAGVVPEILRNKIHNYIVFKNVYLNLISQHNLYIPFNENLYGPLFGIFIAPFTYLPNNVGVIVWVLANAFFLYYAIGKIPISKDKKAFILIASSLEMMNMASYVQTNAAVAACIILGYCFLQQGKEWKAAFFILLATFVKLYGIVGLAFFFFSKNRLKFIMWLAIWSVIFFVAPMLLSNPAFILQSYIDWKNTLVQKNANNVIESFYQNISFPGIIRHVFYGNVNDSMVIILGMFLFATQYIPYKYFSDSRFQLYILCSTLIFTVIYSTGSESPTYIISFVAVCLWYVLQKPSTFLSITMLLFFIFTSLSRSDFFTPHFRDVFMRPYCIQAFPSTITWFIIIYQVWKKQFLLIPQPKVTDKKF